MLVIDIQPGRGSFLAGVEALAPWLSVPDVGVALDPEWELQPGQSPLAQIGYTTAAEINATSNWLSSFTPAHRLREAFARSPVRPDDGR